MNWEDAKGSDSCLILRYYPSFHQNELKKMTDTTADSTAGIRKRRLSDT